MVRADVAHEGAATRGRHKFELPAERHPRERYLRGDVQGIETKFVAEWGEFGREQVRVNALMHGGWIVSKGLVAGGGHVG